MKKTVSIFLSFLIICGLFSISGCGKAESFKKSDGKISVVTTIFPYYDFVRQLAGDKADIRLLLSPGSDPHSYEPTPSDIVAIENCDLFIYNGGESDEWVDGVLSSIENKNVKVMKMMEYVTLRHEQSMDHNHEHAEHEDMDDNDEGHDHEEGEEYDEHIWTSPVNAAAIVEIISQTLAQVDPENGPYYQENAAAYTEQLRALDGRFRQIVDGGKRRMLVVADKFPLRYFADTYGLTYRAAFSGCSTDTEPSARTIAYLIDQVRAEGIPAVYYLELSNRG